MKTYKLQIGGEQFKTRILEYSESKIVLIVNDDEYEVSIEHEEADRTPRIVRAPRTQQPLVHTSTKAVPVASNSENDVPAPLPGVILSLNVKVGDSVKSGDDLLTLEAMKMENKIHSPKDGIVIAIHVTEGNSVQEGQNLLEIGE